MITTERLTEILIEVTNGIKVNKTDTPEEARTRRKLAREVKAIGAKGGVVDIPSEFA